MTTRSGKATRATAISPASARWDQRVPGIEIVCIQGFVFCHIGSDDQVSCLFSRGRSIGIEGLIFNRYPRLRGSRNLFTMGRRQNRGKRRAALLGAMTGLPAPSLFHGALNVVAYHANCAPERKSSAICLAEVVYFAHTEDWSRNRFHTCLDLQR